MNSKHNALLHCLASELAGSGDLYLEQRFSFGSVNGEADLIVIKGDSAEIYEIKSSHKVKYRNHALQQLERGAEYIKHEFGIKKVDKFYVHGFKGSLEYEKEQIL